MTTTQSTKNWMRYVQRTTSNANNTEIAAQVGITPSSVSRWSKSLPQVTTVRQFALAYHRPVLEAFVAAGFLTAREAGMQRDVFIAYDVKDGPSGDPVAMANQVARWVEHMTFRIHPDELTGRITVEKEEGE